MRKLPSRRIRVAGGTALAISLVAGVLATRLSPGLRAALWSGLMLTSFVGWGSLVNLWLTRERWMDWGLRAGWGLALFVLTGGVLCGAHLAVRPILIAHVSLGVLALLVITALRQSALPSSTALRRRLVLIFGRAGMTALVLSTYGMAVFTFLAFLGNHSFQPSDDPPFYFTLAEKLMQTGSMFEPFMARRAELFGGQVYL
ncbi:MAG: hypothetical protein M3O50_10895, partial [Myxococcota bacterium]|nr:hypothetical protein [Myxococcota bacterium]